MNWNFSSLAHIPIEFVYTAFAVMGGVARYANSYANGVPFKVSILVASATVAGFSGLMFALFGQTMNMPSQIQFIMAGTGGFFGEQTMKWILEELERRTKI
jgi:hypothetical protein